MRYDYFERNGCANLYRVPAEQQTPLEYVISGCWDYSAFGNRDALLAEGRSKPITAQRASEISAGAPVELPGYDYWEKSGGLPMVVLYRTPAGMNSPVECFDDGKWTRSIYHELPPLSNPPFLFSRITESRAQQLGSGAVVELDETPRYFTNDTDLYRLTGGDVFHYWSDVNGDWSNPCTPGNVITTYREISAERAKLFNPDAFPPVRGDLIYQAEFFSGTDDVLFDYEYLNNGRIRISVYNRL